MRPVPFANSLAVASGVFAIVLFLLRFVAPRLFVLVFNSQFFSADVASLLPSDTGLSALLAALSVVVITSWIFGLVWASLYNRWTKGRG